jgi:hypothetical protein
VCVEGVGVGLRGGANCEGVEKKNIKMKVESLHAADTLTERR